MIKLLIVEDELLTRVGIESMVKWEEHGFTVAGVAENGRQGLNLAIELKPDIIITDVIMPGMNGIELIRAIRNTELHPRFLVLSSYNEYKYVREALKLGAEDYILKLDIEPDLLLETLKKIKGTIESDPDRPPRTPAATWQEKSICLLKLLNGDLKNEIERVETFANAGIDLPEKNLILVVSKDYTSPGDLQQVEFYPAAGTIIRTLNELIAHFGKTFGCTIKNQIYLNILSPDHLLSGDKLLQMKKETEGVLKDYFHKTYNIPLSVRTTDLVQTFGELSRVFHMIIESEENSTQPKSVSETGKRQDREITDFFPAGTVHSGYIVLKVKNFIEMNYANPHLDLETISGQNHITPNHLCKIFKREMNISPIQYLTKVRLDHAKRLLKTTGKQVKEIGILVGYRNAYYFSRLFKKNIGISPNDFRNC